MTGMPPHGSNVWAAQGNNEWRWRPNKRRWLPTHMDCTARCLSGMDTSIGGMMALAWARGALIVQTPQGIGAGGLARQHWLCAEHELPG